MVGVDLSERMLAEARARTNDTGIVYRRAELEAFAPAPASVDLAVSTLALHYHADYPANVHRDKTDGACRKPWLL